MTEPHIPSCARRSVESSAPNRTTSMRKTGLQREKRTSAWLCFAGLMVFT